MFRAFSGLGLVVWLLFAPPSPLLAQPGSATNGLEQDYDPAPAMWRLADEDTTIYLLGTVHQLPPGFRWRNEQLDAIVEEVDALVLESSEEDAAESMAAVSSKFDELLEDRTPTSLRLVPAARGKWRRLVEMSGQNFEEADRTPLMFALMGFGMGVLDFGPSSYEYGVETVLTADFARSGRPVLSIEDTGRVMLSIFRISDELVIPNLERDLLRWDGVNRQAMLGDRTARADETDWELEHSWARGEMQEEMDFGLGDAKLARAFHRVLLTERNRRWAIWLDGRLDEPGNILVAVGAGHFEGEGSVLDMLRERGLEAERIN